MIINEDVKERIAACRADIKERMKDPLFDVFEIEDIMFMYSLEPDYIFYVLPY